MTTDKNLRKSPYTIGNKIILEAFVEACFKRDEARIRDLISAAFVWGCTPEGGDYWASVHLNSVAIDWDIIRKVIEENGVSITKEPFTDKEMEDIFV